MTGMMMSESQCQLNKALDDCANVLGLVASPDLFAQWRKRSSPSVVRETLLSTLDNLLTAIKSLRTDPAPDDPQHLSYKDLADKERSLRILRQLIKAWDPATTPAESLTLRARAYFGDAPPHTYGSLSTWPDTGEPVNPAAMNAIKQEVAERDAAFKGSEKTEAVLQDIIAGRLSGADAARELFPAAGWPLARCQEKPRVGRALGEEGVRAVLGDKRSTEQALRLLFEAEGERMGPFVESLGAEVVDIFITSLEGSTGSTPQHDQKVISALQAMADPAHPLMLVRGIRTLIKLSTKAIQGLPLETVERAAELLLAQAESAVDTLAHLVLKQATPEQSEALLRAGRESPAFNPRVKDWLG